MVMIWGQVCVEKKKRIYRESSSELKFQGKSRVYCGIKPPLRKFSVCNLQQMSQPVSQCKHAWLLNSTIGKSFFRYLKYLTIIFKFLLVQNSPLYFIFLDACSGPSQNCRKYSFFHTKFILLNCCLDFLYSNSLLKALARVRWRGTK